MAAATVQTPLSTESFASSGSSIQRAQFQPQLNNSDKPAKNNIDAILNYFKENEDGSPPAPTYIDRPETYERPYEAHSVTVHDVSDDEAKYSLDKNGFQFFTHTSVEKDFLDDEQIKAAYYPETEQLLKDVTGASRIFIFDHTIRRQAPDLTVQSRSLRGPVQRVHVDQSYSAALSRVSYHLPELADELLKGRVQIINVWRPISQVLRDPLAFAEAGSVPDSDLVTLGLIYPNRQGETYSIRHNASHKWFYKSGLTPEEVVLIKCFDSKTDGRARRVPHTAFVDPTAAPDAPARESIEVRALVFHPDDRE